MHFRGYRNCASTVPFVSPIGTVNWVADSGCVAPVQTLGWANLSITEVTPICPNDSTQCTSPNAAISGVQEFYWISEYDFCQANCSTYTLEFASCCRNNAITTLFNPASTQIYVSTTFNPFIQPCNSSPSF
ncbi:MAG: hypothetical protein AAF570_27815, partial [Bacteroidota bacterium]